MEVSGSATSIKWADHLVLLCELGLTHVLRTYTDIKSAKRISWDLLEKNISPSKKTLALSIGIIVHQVQSIYLYVYG